MRLEATNAEEFARIVANHAYRKPQQPIGELIRTRAIESGGIEVYLDMDVFESGGGPKVPTIPEDML